MEEDSPAARIRLALEMFEFGMEMQRARLHRVHPDAVEATIDEMVQKWLLSRPGAPLGDAIGHSGERFS